MIIKTIIKTENSFNEKFSILVLPLFIDIKS